MATVHDVKPMLFPALVRRRNLYSLIESMLVGDKWEKIDHVVTDSNCSRRDILAHLHVPAHHLTVVHPGIDLERFTPGMGQGRAERRRPFVLSVAGGDPTKNVETLVEAFGRLPLTIREGYDLMLVGDFRRRPELRARAAQLGLEKQTLFPG
ncbi:MAG: glycosyltransferase, partial [Nitrospira sp.]